MEKIHLSQTLPHIFASLGRDTTTSDVWQQELTLEKGKLYLIEASSGMGKSSLCSYLMGYRNDYEGKISFDGNDIRQFSTKDWVNIRRKHLSLLFQELRLFPELTAYENVEIKNRLTHWKTKQEIENWFEILGIADKLDTQVGKMSFGQQQRVALMRALSQSFDFLLVDEPISHLDEENARTVADLMLQETQRQGASIISTSIGKAVALPYNQTLHL